MPGDDDFDVLSLLISLHLHHQRSALVLSFSRFYHFLSIEDRRRRDRRIPRIALADPHESSFVRLYRSANDQALITMSGFDHRTFSYLLNKFTHLFHRYSPYSSNTGRLIRELRNNGSRGGRPRSLDSCSCLGLVLTFTRTKGALTVLQLVFGLSFSVLCIFLKFGIRLLIKILLQEDGAKVSIPSAESISFMIELVREKYPALDGVWCVLDGLKVPIERPGDYRTQNAYYNGWLHGHYIGCIFVFAPTGLVVAASVNNPGSWHDSFIAENSGTYNKLEDAFLLTGGICVVDAAFSLKRCSFLIKSGKEPTANSAEQIIVRDAQATSLRQSAEWGMRGLQGSFPRLKEKITYSDDVTDRRLFLSLIPMLYNFRTTFVGLNQIRSHFFPAFEMHGDYVLDLLL